LLPHSGSAGAQKHSEAVIAIDCTTIYGRIKRPASFSAALVCREPRMVHSFGMTLIIIIIVALSGESASKHSHDPNRNLGRNWAATFDPKRRTYLDR
jgi:hypothetical protein